MRVLFIHQNMPGQFKHLAAALAADPANEVAFITARTDRDLPGVRRISYARPPGASLHTHFYLRSSETAVRHGQQVARALLQLRQEKFAPDIIVAHAGWGEALFAKDVMPRTPLLTYAEFYYASQGADIGFDPADPPTLDVICRARTRNAPLLLTLEAADAGLSPTEWQKSRHPDAVQSKIEVIFDGVDTEHVRPRADAVCILPDGTTLKSGDEILTFVARNLEPYRGFPTFMRALPRILAERPQARVIIVGGDEVSYGQPPKEGGTWRESLMRETGLDHSPHGGRLHFTGRIPYDAYVSLLQLSSVHVYLTYPFVLSWSCVEAMAAGCLIVASDTAPVHEFLQDGHNALFVPFFAPDILAERVCEVLGAPNRFQTLRGAARSTVVQHHDLAGCLKRQTALIRRVAGR